MNELTPATVALLRHFSAAPNHVMSMEALAAVIPDSDELQWRLRVLKGEKLIRVEEMGTETGNGYVRLGIPLSYRMTPAGLDYLSALEQSAQQQAQRDADAARKQMSDRAQAFVDRQQQFRHDFKVAGFSVVLTLLIEHGSDCVNALKRAVEMIRGLLK